jgi:chorismate dehydratase
VRRLRYGRISYVNVGPVETAFDAGAVTRDVEVVPAVPSQLNHAMSAGEIDAGAISAAHYLENREHFARIADLCIASDGPVRSVLFVSPKPPALVGSSTIAHRRRRARGAQRDAAGPGARSR